MLDKSFFVYVKYDNKKQYVHLDTSTVSGYRFTRYPKLDYACIDAVKIKRQVKDDGFNAFIY